MICCWSVEQGEMSLLYAADLVQVHTAHRLLCCESMDQNHHTFNAPQRSDIATAQVLSCQGMSQRGCAYGTCTAKHDNVSHSGRCKEWVVACHVQSTSAGMRMRQ